jgi:hypothetical protein
MWPTADQAHEQEETPGGPVTLGGQRRHDAEPLGSVVQREPDDEDGGQADIANCGAAADIRARTSWSDNGPLSGLPPKLGRPNALDKDVQNRLICAPCSRDGMVVSGP